MADRYKLTFKTPDGDVVVEAGADEYVLDAAEDAGLDLAWSCRSGVCSTCTCKLVSGEMDQSEQAFLDDEQAGDGYVLVCVGRAKSDCTFEIDKQGEL